MAEDRSGGANPSAREREAGARASRKTIGESGHPQKAPTPTDQDAADRTQTTVRHPLEPGSQEASRAMDDD